MIATVTVNPVIDYTALARGFEAGRFNLSESCICAPGGKGVNVSLLLTSLGMENIAYGLAAGFTGKELIRLMEVAGCRTDFVFTEQGSTRINVRVQTPDGMETGLGGVSPEIPPEALDEIGRKLSVLGPGDSLVLSGSVPPSLPMDSYARLLHSVEGKGLITVVDTGGEALLKALPCRPFLIKPNQEELSQVCGTEIEDIPTAAACARLLQKRGARNVAVSMGAKGALLVQEDGTALFCQSARGETVSALGAGDSFVAGFLYGLRLHGAMDGALRWGVCAGAATAFSQGIATGEKVKSLYLQVGNVHRV